MMKLSLNIRSFRLRIALFAASLAGSTLISFGFAAWILIYKTKIDHLDAEIQSQLLQNISRNPQNENTLQKSIAISVINRDDTVLHQSLNWPNDWSIKKLCSPSELNCQPFPHPPIIRQRLPFFYPQFNNSPGHKSPLPPPPSPLMLSSIVTKDTEQGLWRFGVLTSPDRRLAIAISLREVDREMAAIRNLFLVAVPVLLILVAIAAWWLSESALKPIHKLTGTIRGVTVKGLDQRIPIGTTDIEFVELIDVFNQMMERLERSFQQASRFSADAAHELKTPLAILQGELELALHKAEPGSQVQQNLSNLLDEVRRLSSIVRKLLLFSLADSGQMRLHQVDVNLSQILADLTEDIELLAPELSVTTNISPDLWVKADRDLLIQILQNLISNAIKYNLPNGWVKIDAKSDKRIVYLTITNSSQDISIQDRKRIFERFHRGDPSRNRQIEGIGLGLSLSREIARAHHGDLLLDNTPQGETAFTLKLHQNNEMNIIPNKYET
jgi:two-component system heavy metal sensor histidine kinase CusS